VRIIRNTQIEKDEVLIGEAGGTLFFKRLTNEEAALKFMLCMKCLLNYRAGMLGSIR
jgi:hypothetical protein